VVHSYVDGTYGRGGHSRAILGQLGPDGRLLALDRDPDAVAAGRALQAEDPRFRIVHSAWSALGSGLNNDVNAIAAIGSDLYVGGDFTEVGQATGVLD